VRYITGHGRAGADPDFDWEGLADPNTTLVVYMGLANIAVIAARLIARGRAPETPVLAVSNGTRRNAARFVSTLARIAGDAERAELKPPTLFIVGEVVDLAASLGTLSDEAHRHQIAAAE
jgi:uroporphyrin-III C-methyltransferase